MRVSAVLESLPGVGKARAAKIMERLEISPTRRVRGLGANQRKALEAEFSGEKVVEAGAARTTPGRGRRVVTGHTGTADRALRPLRGRQGHGGRRGPATAPRGLAVGVGDHPPSPPGRADGVALLLRRRRRVRPADRRPTGCWSGPSTPATGTAHRVAPLRSGWLRGRRRSWRSSCRAPARCVRAIPRRSWSSWRRRPGPRWSAGWPAGLGAARRPGAPAGPRAGRAGRRRRVRRGRRQRRRHPGRR